MIPLYDVSNKHDYQHPSDSKSSLIPAGIYLCEILAVSISEYKNGNSAIVTDVDVIHGEYKGFFQKNYDSQKDNGYKRWKSNTKIFIPSKSSADWQKRNFMKKISAIASCNEGFNFDGEESNLVGKKCIVAFHHKELLRPVSDSFGMVMKDAVAYNDDGEPITIWISEGFDFVSLNDYKAHKIPKCDDIIDKKVLEERAKLDQSFENDDLAVSLFNIL